VWRKKGHRSGHKQGKQASWHGLAGSGLSGVSQRGIVRHVPAQKRGAAQGDWGEKSGGADGWCSGGLRVAGNGCGSRSAVGPAR
jgi:hypothetical protein